MTKESKFPVFTVQNYIVFKQPYSDFWYFPMRIKRWLWTFLVLTPIIMKDFSFQIIFYFKVYHIPIFCERMSPTCILRDPSITFTCTESDFWLMSALFIVPWSISLHKMLFCGKRFYCNVLHTKKKTETDSFVEPKMVLKWRHCDKPTFETFMFKSVYSG